MQTSAHLIGGKILDASDLEAMNKKEVSTRNYKYCTINSGEHGSFLAEVAYSNGAEAWEPVAVKVDGQWISPDAFDSMEEGESYSCENYRPHP